MAIAAKCAMCGHGYQAADHMAGRRVRCKHCGNTFQLPAEAIDAATPFKRPDEIEMASAPAGAPLRADPLAPPSRANAAAAAAVAAAARKSPSGGDPPHGSHAPRAASAAPAAKAPVEEESDPEADAFLQEAPDDVFEEAFHEFTTVRGNTPFVFPGSMFLDRWLPLILVVALVAWLGYQVLIAGVAGDVDGSLEEPGWVGVVRLLVLLMTYSSIVFPACLLGVRMAARKLKYELPTGAPWRAFATFLLPVTLGCVLWLSGGTVAGLIFGTMLGLIVALPIMWLLFRIRPDDAPISLGYGAAGFGAGILGAVVLLSLLNLLLVGVVKGTNAKHSLTLSPFGPGFMWEGATIQPPKPAIRPKRGAPEEQPDEPLVSNDPDLGPPPEGMGPDDPGNGDGEGPGVGDPDDSSPVAVPPPGVDMEAVDAEQQPIGEENFTTDMVEEGGLPDAAPARGHIVAEVNKRFAGDLRQVVFPLIPGGAIAVVKKGDQPGEHELELWDANNWRATAGASFIGMSGLPDEYLLSSDGSYVARIATWPQLSVQVYSFANDRLLRPIIKLDREGVDAHILGFSAPDRIVVQYMKDRASRVEIWDVEGARRLARIEVGSFRPVPGNSAISNNGNLLAMIVQEPRQPGRLDIYDLSAGALARQFMIEAMASDNKVVARGLTFSEEADRVAALFEHKGAGLFLCWGAGDLPIYEHVLPVGFVPAGIDPDNFGGDALGMLDQGRAWILYGSRVYDTDSGVRLGELGIPNVAAQWVRGPDLLLLLQRLGGTQHALLEVRLDFARARGGGRGAAGAGDGLE